jgi:histidine triad (HIT) family protein
MPVCVFCGIVAGDLPAVQVDETSDTLSFMDINPMNPGHVLTVPKRHAVDIGELSAEEGASVFEAVRRMAARVRAVLTPDGVDLFMANGAAAGQTVFHAHVHTIPRWDGDAWTDPWTPTPGDADEIAAIGARLRG